MSKAIDKDLVKVRKINSNVLALDISLDNQIICITLFEDGIITEATVFNGDRKFPSISIESIPKIDEGQ